MGAPAECEFQAMLTGVIDMLGIEQKKAAEEIGCSPQYLSDLMRGRRLPSVEITNKICKWLGRGPKGIRSWHGAAARAHGWDI